MDTIMLSALLETLTLIKEEQGDMPVYFHIGGLENEDSIEAAILGETEEGNKCVVLLH